MKHGAVVSQSKWRVALPGILESAFCFMKMPFRDETVISVHSRGWFFRARTHEPVSGELLKKFGFAADTELSECWRRGKHFDFAVDVEGDNVLSPTGAEIFRFQLSKVMQLPFAHHLEGGQLFLFNVTNWLNLGASDEKMKERVQALANLQCQANEAKYRVCEETEQWFSSCDLEPAVTLAGWLTNLSANEISDLCFAIHAQYRWWVREGPGGPSCVRFPSPRGSRVTFDSYRLEALLAAVQKGKTREQQDRILLHKLQEIETNLKPRRRLDF